MQHGVPFCLTAERTSDRRNQTSACKVHISRAQVCLFRADCELLFRTRCTNNSFDCLKTEGWTKRTSMRKTNRLVKINRENFFQVLAFSGSREPTTTTTIAESLRGVNQMGEQLKCSRSFGRTAFALSILWPGV